MEQEQSGREELARQKQEAENMQLRQVSIQLRFHKSFLTKSLPL